MTAAVQSPEDLINLALRRIGYDMRVGSIWEGSRASKMALDLYSQTRDAVLREINPDFAKEIASAVLSGQPAPIPWAYSYIYPAACLRVRNVYIAGDANNPLPVLWTVG